MALAEQSMTDYDERLHSRVGRRNSCTFASELCLLVYEIYAFARIGEHDLEL